MNSDRIIERLEAYLEIDGSSANRFANRVGIDPGNLRKMLAGKQTVTDKTLRKISDTEGVSFEWLKYGEGEMMDINGISQVTIANRLSDYIEYDAITTPSSFAIKAGIDPANFSKMLADKQKITAKTLKKISEAHGLSMDWLLTGEGEMHTEKTKPEISYTDGTPYYDVDFQLGFDEMPVPNTLNPEYLIKMPGYEKATLWCNASGHSMEPEISNGDIIALKRIEDFSFLPYGDIYGFITTNGLRTIKRLGRSDKEGYYRLIPTNSNYEEQEIPKNIIAGVYRVMGAMKAF